MPAITRNTTGVNLPFEVSSEIWPKTIESSAVMQLAQRMELPGSGVEIDMITGEPTANWVDETGAKPVSTHSVGSKKIKGYTMAVIVPFSNQFRRDKRRLYDEMVARAPMALGTKLDKTVFGGDQKPGELFDTMADVTAVDIETNPWTGLVTADAAIAAGGGITNGWAISPQAKSILLTAVDGVQRPLFVNSTTADGAIPALLGHPTHEKKGVYIAAVAASGNDPAVPAQLGFGGDWTSAYYGVVEDISTSITDQASITIDNEVVNLWERNMFAVRFEFEVGFRMKYAEHFVKLTGAAPSAETPSADTPNGESQGSE